MSGGTTNIVLAGVGGQGSVLATRVLALAADRAGHAVVTSEVHGMSQRGGTVVTAVRFGPVAGAPTVPESEADFLVAFERLEAARHLGLLRPGGVALVNDQRIAPSMESLKTAAYPADIEALGRDLDVTVLAYPALRLATELGNEKLASMVLLGALSGFLFLPRAAWREAIREIVPRSTVAANDAAFETGAEWMVGAPSFSF